MSDLLTREEERALGLRMRAGDRSARDELVERNMGLVYSVVNRYGTDDPATDQDDLVQEGVIGLMRALDKWEPERGYKLSTFAVWWIRNRVQRVAVSAGAIPRDKNPHVPRKTAWGQRVHALRQSPILELDEPVGEGDRTLLDVIAGHEWGDPEQEALTRILVHEVIGAAKLSETHRRILWRRMAGYLGHEAAAPEGLSRGMPTVILDKIRRAAQRRFPEDFMSDKRCLEDGCDKARMRTKSGRELTRCEEHQRQYWREAKAARDAQRNGNGAHMPAVVDMPEVPVVQPHLNGHCVAGDECDCLYREVVEALAAKHPAVRDLVDAMRRVREIREELEL